MYISQVSIYPEKFTYDSHGFILTIILLMSGLVALQALSRPEDRAVATSTRNLLRSLGGVAGVAVSTALQYGVTEAAVRARIPAELVPAVMDGRWRPGDQATAGQDADILDARMKGFQAVFAMLVPLMALCLLGSFLVSDEILKGDEKKDERSAPAQTVADVTPPLSIPVEVSRDEKNRNL